MYPELLQRIGNTPLIKLNWDLPPTVLAKLEYLNPGGSIKDRSALFMIEEAEQNGTLRPGGTIVEASSGNQGIAIAMIAAHKGYQAIITVPQHCSQEKVATLRAYGAQVEVCPDCDRIDDPKSYHCVAKNIAEGMENTFMPNQYQNTRNVEAHYQRTGPEIWEQTGGNFTHLICGMGSCGTISGVGRYLKEQNPNIQILGVDSAHSLLSSDNPRAYETEGIGVDIIGETLNREVIDQIIPVTDEDAFSKTRTLAAKGYMVGPSSGAVMFGAEKVLSQLSVNETAVLIFADSGRAYLSKVFC